MVAAEVAKENTVAGNVVCTFCRTTNPYGRFSSSIKCMKCEKVSLFF